MEDEFDELDEFSEAEDLDSLEPSDEDLQEIEAAGMLDGLDDDYEIALDDSNSADDLEEEKRENWEEN